MFISLKFIHFLLLKSNLFFNCGYLSKGSVPAVTDLYLAYLAFSTS